MINEEKSILASVVRDVLKDYAFLFSEAATIPEMGLGGSDFIEATIEVEGSLKARFVLCVACPLGVDIAANILGVEPGCDESVEHSEDSVKELLNIISSHVLSKLAGDSGIFSIGIARSKIISDSSIWMTRLIKHEPVTVLVERKPLMIWMST
jgi:hypothetical protein